MGKPNSRSHRGKQGPGTTAALHTEPARSATRSAKAARQARAPGHGQTVSPKPGHEPYFTGEQNHRCEVVLDQGHGLAALVWKYFESEIREALIEVQDLLGGAETDPRSE
jgi:hypothetical protein